MRDKIVDILYKYHSEGSYINIALNNLFENTKINSKDKDLITQVVYGTIQNQIYIDYQLEPYLNTKTKPYIKILLQMSLYQLIFLDKIPEYAIINEAVQIAKNKHGKHVSALVNAVLRNFIRDGQRKIEETDPLKKLSIETSTPLWLVKMLTKQYDEKTCELICIESLKRPLLSARVNTLKTTVEYLIENYSLKKGHLSQDAVLFDRGNIANSDLYKDGYVTVQDESSQLVARLLNPPINSHVLDMCSAPGSKTTHLAAIMENTGSIDAFDIHEHKISLIESNATRLGITNINARAYDSTKLRDLYEKSSFSYILLDAPCSGLGVIARKPEIKYQSSNIMDEIIDIQAKLLDEAYYLLANNGILVYSTCTINKKENEKQIEKFINKYQDLTIIEQTTILPYQYQSDGFYMCKIIKEERGNT